jgi:hypothetical protein
MNQDRFLIRAGWPKKKYFPRGEWNIFILYELSEANKDNKYLKSPYATRVDHVEFVDHLK